MIMDKRRFVLVRYRLYPDKIKLRLETILKMAETDPRTLSSGSQSQLVPIHTYVLPWEAGRGPLQRTDQQSEGNVERSYSGTREQNSPCWVS